MHPLFYQFTVSKSNGGAAITILSLSIRGGMGEGEVDGRCSFSGEIFPYLLDTCSGDRGLLSSHLCRKHSDAVIRLLERHFCLRLFHCF